MNSRNKITDCLGFAAPHCSFEGAWVKGHNSAGSLLTVADLSENNIEHMGDLSRHQFLEQLILHQNCISVMEGMQALKYLRVLNLSYNNISVIEGLDNLPIKELHLKGNKIKQLHGLDKLPHLTLLDVSENSIISLSQLEQCNSLVHLDVSFNCIEYIRQVEYLQNIPWLTSLVLCNNPCEAKELYRLRVLYRLPKLLFLDNSEAAREDKVLFVVLSKQFRQSVAKISSRLLLFSFRIGARIQSVPLRRRRSVLARGCAASIPATSELRGSQPAAVASRRGARCNRC